MAGKLSAALRRPFDVEGSSLQIRGSIGVAVHPDHGKDPDALLEAADAAMYVAKRNETDFAVHGTEIDRVSMSEALSR